MQLNVPVDIADTLRTALADMGISACARPVPRDLASAVPLSCVEPIGGGRNDVVVDRFSVRVYTWAETEAEAVAESSQVVAALAALKGEVVDGTQVYRVTITTLPYPAHDTEHPDLARVCFLAQVHARATTIEK